MYALVVLRMMAGGSVARFVSSRNHGCAGQMGAMRVAVARSARTFDSTLAIIRNGGQRRLFSPTHEVEKASVPSAVGHLHRE